ncbi:MAG TPA: hypothetical protein VF814_07510 [Casimicrobiaceae bacterium]
MISGWWTVWAFVAGGSAGLLLAALLRVAGNPRKVGSETPELRSFE